MNPKNRPNFFQTLRICLAGLLAWGSSCVGAEELRLELQIQGSNLSVSSPTDKSNLKDWYALALRDGNLVVEAATKPIPSDEMQISGKQADRLLEGKYQPTANKAYGLSVEAPADTLLLARLQREGGKHEKLRVGAYPSVLAPVVLHEGWRAAVEINGKKWQFFTAHEKRPDGKLLAGSLEIKAERQPSTSTNTSAVILPRANGMVFQRQELLWLGDWNQDGEPDLLLKRTWITGEVDFVLVLSPVWGSAYLDPDRPAHYFSSGVEPDSNGFTWSKGQPTPSSIHFVQKGSFSLNETDWVKQLEGSDKRLPQTLADRQLKLEGDTMRLVLERVPRAAPSEDTPNRASSGAGAFWGGDTLVRISFRGKTQVLTEIGQPDGQFTLSVGLVNGKPALRMQHDPHYNNGFTHYWVWNESDMRFRRVLILHSQGC